MADGAELSRVHRAEPLLEEARTAGVEATAIGTAGGDRVHLETLSTSVAELPAVWRTLSHSLWTRKRH